MESKFVKLVCRTFLVIGLFILFSVPVKATSYYVDGENGNDSTGVGSIENPWKTIQKAAGTVVASDTVNVKGGITYSETVTPSNSGSSGNYIVYQGWAGTGYPTIDATGKSYGFNINSKKYIVISGFFVKNATTADIRIWSPYEDDYLIIKNNICTNSLMGAYNAYSGANKFYNNVFYNNTMAGIHIDGDSDISVEIKNNIAMTNGTIGFGGLSVSNGVVVVSNNNNSWSNTGGNYVHFTPGANDISSNPYFVDAANGDFRLQYNSPSIDSGVDVGITIDIAGIIRPFWNGYDMGANEYDNAEVPEPAEIVPGADPESRTSSLSLIASYTGERTGDQFALRQGGPNMQIADLTGDGTADILIGARYHPTYGGIYIFNGGSSITGESASLADRILRENVYGAFGGMNLVGDINGDGKNEILSGNYRYSTNHTGGVYIYSLDSLPGNTVSVSNVLATITGPFVNSRFGTSGNILGDVNGDGYGDFITSAVLDNKAYVFFGSATLSSRNANDADVIYTNDINSQNLYFSDGETDINNDGKKDIVIGCPSCSTYGSVYIFLGDGGLVDKNLSQADIIISGAEGHSIGNSMVGADFNGDGANDILINGYIFFSASDFTSRTIASADISMDLSDILFSTSGVNSFAAADINNDGCSDVVLGTAASQIYVLYGCGGLDKKLSSSDLVYNGTGSLSSSIGQSFAIGDVNDDGYKEILAGDPLFTINGFQGTAYLFSPPHTNIDSVDISLSTGFGGTTAQGTLSGNGAVKSLEYSFDGGSWSPCTATDGSFNSENEGYTCNIPSGDPGSSHTVRFRAENIYGVHTPASKYTEKTFRYQTNAGPTQLCSSHKLVSAPEIIDISPLSSSSLQIQFVDSGKNESSGYFVEYGTKPGIYKYATGNIGKYGNGKIVINSLNLKSIYYFRIRNDNGCGGGNWSQESHYGAGIQTDVDQYGSRSTIRKIPQMSPPTTSVVSSPIPNNYSSPTPEAQSTSPTNIFSFFSKIIKFVRNFLTFN